MELKFSHVFTLKLNAQLEFIAQHRPNVARKFKNEIFKAIKSIPKSHLKHRKSIFFDSEDIRDLVFKKHIVVYKIDKEKNQILVFGFVYNQGSL
jgi:plasmid stabilization system protein ParE